MTTPNAQPLEGLRERVKAATGPSAQIDAEIYATIGGAPHTTTAGARIIPLVLKGDPKEWPSFTASIDAALALAGRLLPGWRISIFGNHMTGAKGGKGWRVGLQSPQKAKPDAWGFRWPKVNAECFYAPTAPLAILAALLSALTSLQDQNNER